MTLHQEYRLNDAALIRHRKEFDLAGSKNATFDERMSYTRLLTARRADIATYVLAPPAGASRAEWTRFHERRQHRLELGDDGYIGWLAAKHAFIEEVKAACVVTWPVHVDDSGIMDPEGFDTLRFESETLIDNLQHQALSPRNAMFAPVTPHAAEGPTTAAGSGSKRPGDDLLGPNAKPGTPVRWKLSTSHGLNCDRPQPHPYQARPRPQRLPSPQPMPSHIKLTQWIMQPLALLTLPENKIWQAHDLRDINHPEWFHIGLRALFDEHRGFPLRKLQFGADIHVTYGHLPERVKKQILRDAAPVDDSQERKENMESFEVEEDEAMIGLIHGSPGEE
ncbi:Helicase C-terminal [Penicillium sp. IBT 16267x]|nr:Helicase C-terminal [Penicillium sp. IBT 16267x]